MAAENGAAQAVCMATNYSPWFGLNLNIPAGHLKAALENPDAIQVAAQAGRLDIVSGLLGALGILIALSAIFGFWSVRGAAMKAASAAAREEMQTLLPKLLTQACVNVLKERPDLIGAALRHDPAILVSVSSEARAYLFGDIDGGEADDIAQVVGNGNGGN
jgi:hypothetical protein